MCAIDELNRSGQPKLKNVDRDYGNVKRGKA
jgi:hypothetical protein